MLLEVLARKLTTVGKVRLGGIRYREKARSLSCKDSGSLSAAYLD